MADQDYNRPPDGPEPRDPDGARDRFDYPDGPADPSWPGRAGRRGPSSKRSWAQRLFSPRASRFIASGVPLSVVGSEQGQGLLAAACEEFGWQVSDGDPQADALLETVPMRGTAGYRAGNVIHGRFDPFAARLEAGLPTGEWAFLAFDAVEDSRLGRSVRSCYTAVPTLIDLPPLRVLPDRFPTGPARGMVVFPTIDPVFDARFKLLAANGDSELHALATLIDDDVRDTLCAGPDLDELWTADSHLIITTAGPHTEENLARHLEILGALLRALRGQAARDG